MQSITLDLANEDATNRFGADLAMAMDGGMMVYLQGDLGSGKTTLARAVIRAIAGDQLLEVPSPTFSLVQEYRAEHAAKPSDILHADLYRIDDEREVSELGITDADDKTLVMVEWPERAGEYLPPADIAVNLLEKGDGRRAVVSAADHLIGAISRSLAIGDFLTVNWSADCERRFLQGDASTRSYEAVTANGKRRILMNAPRQADGPPVRDGKPYSQIAHLAEDVSAFVGVAEILNEARLRTPAIHASSLDEGLLLLEDLGNAAIVDGDEKPIESRYMAAVEMLAELHGATPRRQARLEGGRRHEVPDYDRQAMMIEVELLVDWYAPRKKGSDLTKAERSDFLAIWHDLFDRLKGGERHLVLRDFHSPNILWQAEEEGSRRIGLLDFQDAVIGPTAYDVASLAQDARVDVPDELEEQLRQHYMESRRDDKFDRERFLADYAIMAAQRVTKILGIFVRLDERDGKPHYLKHLPRLREYLSRSLRHDALAPYRQWLNAVMGM